MRISNEWLALDALLLALAAVLATGWLAGRILAVCQNEMDGGSGVIDEPEGGNVFPFQKRQKPISSSVSKTLTTSNKSNEFKNGYPPAEVRLNLISNISVAKGLLATLSLEHPSLWIKKYQRTPPEHLRILLLEVMEEICMSEKTLTTQES